MKFDRLREFQDYLVNWRIPGCDCSVYLNHEEVYRYWTGWADRENNRPMNGDELYFLWSASKVITTSLALRLLEEGKYLMLDPLSDYMPEFANMKVRRTIDGKEEIEDAKSPILVQHLFNMTAGFDYNIGSSHIEEVRKSTDGRCPTREIAKAIAKSPLSFEPGEHWNYSLCHDVLGAFIEVVAGKRLKDYAREVLFDPLGMNDTCYNLPSAEKMKRIAVQYNFHDGLGKYILTNTTCGHILGPEYDSGGAGVVSTCADYAKFADACANFGTAANGYRYLSPASINLWRQNTLNEQHFRDYTWSYTIGYGYGYGVKTMMDPAKSGSLSSVGEFGWGGAAGTQVIIDPDRRLTIVYTQHMMNPQDCFTTPRLKNIVYSCLD